MAAVWLLSQGEYSYFFPRYLLFTAAAWALLAGIGLSRLDARIAAAFVARRAHPGDGAVYQGREHQVSWLMISDGLHYYLSRDMPNGVPAPHQLVVAQSAAQAGTLYPRPCRNPAACLGAEPRIWVVGSGRQLSPCQAVTSAQASLLRPRYRVSLVKHMRGLTVFLLTRVP